MALPKKKNLFFLLLAGALLYFFLSYHIIIIEGNPRNARLLKKSSLSLHYTFLNTRGRSNKSMLSIDILRENGLGDILIEEGLMSEKEENRILQALENAWE
ncbi:MAG: hypothetical protein ACOC6B_05705 [Thermodesulfobacteriota bacterium]